MGQRTKKFHTLTLSISAFYSFWRYPLSDLLLSVALNLGEGQKAFGCGYAALRPL